MGYLADLLNNGKLANRAPQVLARILQLKEADRDFKTYDTLRETLNQFYGFPQHFSWTEWLKWLAIYFATDELGIILGPALRQYMAVLMSAKASTQEEKDAIIEQVTTIQANGKYTDLSDEQIEEYVVIPLGLSKENTLEPAADEPWKRLSLITEILQYPNAGIVNYGLGLLKGFVKKQTFQGYNLANQTEIYFSKQHNLSIAQILQYQHLRHYVSAPLALSQLSNLTKRASNFIKQAESNLWFPESKRPLDTWYLQSCQGIPVPNKGIALDIEHFKVCLVQNDPYLVAVREYHSSVSFFAKRNFTMAQNNLRQLWTTSLSQPTSTVLDDPHLLAEQTHQQFIAYSAQGVYLQANRILDELWQLENQSITPVPYLSQTLPEPEPSIVEKTETAISQLPESDLLPVEEIQPIATEPSAAPLSPLPLVSPSKEPSTQDPEHSPSQSHNKPKGKSSKGKKSKEKSMAIPQPDPKWLEMFEGDIETIAWLANDEIFGPCTETLYQASLLTDNNYGAIEKDGFAETILFLSEKHWLQEERVALLTQIDCSLLPTQLSKLEQEGALFESTMQYLLYLTAEKLEPFKMQRMIDAFLPLFTKQDPLLLRPEIKENAVALSWLVSLRLCKLSNPVIYTNIKGSGFFVGSFQADELIHMHIILIEIITAASPKDQNTKCKVIEKWLAETNAFERIFRVLIPALYDKHKSILQETYYAGPTEFLSQLPQIANTVAPLLTNDGSPLTSSHEKARTRVANQINQQLSLSQTTKELTTKQLFAKEPVLALPTLDDLYNMAYEQLTFKIMYVGDLHEKLQYVLLRKTLKQCDFSKETLYQLLALIQPTVTNNDIHFSTFGSLLIKLYTRILKDPTGVQYIISIVKNPNVDAMLTLYLENLVAPKNEPIAGNQKRSEIPSPELCLSWLEKNNIVLSEVQVKHLRERGLLRMALDCLRKENLLDEVEIEKLFRPEVLLKLSTYYVLAKFTDSDIASGVALFEFDIVEASIDPLAIPDLQPANLPSKDRVFWAVWLLKCQFMHSTIYAGIAKQNYYAEFSEADKSACFSLLAKHIRNLPSKGLKELQNRLIADSSGTVLKEIILTYKKQYIPAQQILQNMQLSSEKRTQLSTLIDGEVAKECKPEALTALGQMFGLLQFFKLLDSNSLELLLNHPDIGSLHIKVNQHLKTQWSLDIASLRKIAAQDNKRPAATGKFFDQKASLAETDLQQESTGAVP